MFLLEQLNDYVMLFEFQKYPFVFMALSYQYTHWGGTMKVTRVTIINFKCQQKHVANLSYYCLPSANPIFWGPPFQTCAFVYKKCDDGNLSYLHSSYPVIHLHSKD